MRIPRVHIPRIPRPKIPLPHVDWKSKLEVMRRVRIPVFKLAVTVESALLLYFSLVSTIPVTGIPGPRAGDGDHYLAYLLYGLLLIGVYHQKGRKWLYPVLLVGANFAFLTEALQLLVPERVFDPLDWVANMLGISTSIVLVSIPGMRKRMPKPDLAKAIPEVTLTLPKLPHIPLPKLRKKKAEPAAPVEKEEKIELTDDPDKA